MEVLSTPECFQGMKDDGMAEKDLPGYAVGLLANENVWLLKPEEGAYFLFYPVNGVTTSIHTIITVNKRKDVFRLTEKATEYYFANNPNCMKLITMIPQHNKSAQMLAAQMGMNMACELKEAVMSNGKLESLFIWGGSVKEYMRGK